VRWQATSALPAGADRLRSTMALVDVPGGVQKGYTDDVYGKRTSTGVDLNWDF